MKVRTETLAGGRPDLAREWHPTKNGALTPEDVAVGSHTKVWWKCGGGDDHEWCTYVKNRTQHGRGCPFCAGRRASREYSFEHFFPELAREWHPTRNGRLRPTDVTPGSRRRVWWRCQKEPTHEWYDSPSTRTSRHRTSKCPYCVGRVHKTNSLATLRPEVAREWHPTKNGTLSASDVTVRSGLRVWWKCSRGPDHEWDASICNRTAAPGCPFCSGRRVSASTSLSALRPDIAAQWHPNKNGALRPSDVTVQAGKRVWWKCRAGPDHEWQSTVQMRSKAKHSRCPFCEMRSLSVTNALSTLFPRLAEEWHPTKNGALRPDQVIGAPAQQAWWRCPRKHTYRASIRERAHGMHNCPACAEP